VLTGVPVLDRRSTGPRHSEGSVTNDAGGPAMPITRSSDDIELAYRVRGDGPTDVLFLHGWAGSGRYFDQTVECLDPSSFRMITFDLRGHGDSSRTDRG
jgi:predicted alpha/beta-fold hydrolase